MSEIESELKLKRFLYLCSENSKYTVQKKNSYNFCSLSQISSVFELIASDKEHVILELVESINNDALCARRETLLFVLAACTRNLKTEKNKNAAYSTVLKVCNSTEELFLFIKFAHCLNKNFSHGLRRIIRNYYLKPDPFELARVVMQRNSYHNWTHKDIMKLIHLKAENTAQDILLTYAYKNLEEAKKKKTEANAEADVVLDEIIKKLIKLDTLKHCHDEKEALELMKEEHYHLEQFPSALLKSQAIWEAIIPTLEIPELLLELNRLNRLGFLKNNTTTLNKVVEVMTDPKKCQASKVQPAQVFIHLKTFERGKPIDPQKKAYIAGLENKAEEPSDEKKVAKDPLCHTNPPKNNAVLGAFYKLLQHSYKNLYVTGRRIMITLDVRDAYMKQSCFESKTVTCFEAASLIALSFLKVEKDVTVAVFKEATVSVVPIDKVLGMTLNQVQQKLKEVPGDSVWIPSAFTWAIENKKMIDVFINLFYSADSLQRAPKNLKSQETPVASLKRYRKTMRLPNTKMVCVSLGGRKLSVADGSPHLLDICGFDPYVPKVIQACCKGVFQ